MVGNRTCLDLVLSVHVQENPLAIGELKRGIELSQIGFRFSNATFDRDISGIGSRRRALVVTCKNLEGMGEGDWSSACVLSRPNSLICPFLVATARTWRMGS
jgi:hypothetical protein